jgi:hypothetical protein
LLVATAHFSAPHQMISTRTRRNQQDCMNND